jgi:hypothetical protein
MLYQLYSDEKFAAVLENRSINQSVVRRRNVKFELLKANAIGKQKDWIKKWVLHLADNYSYRRREKALEIQIKFVT